MTSPLLGYSASSTWCLPSYIWTIGHICRPFMFCASHCIYDPLLTRFYIFMTRDPDNRLPSYHWWADQVLAGWTPFHSPSSISRISISRLWWRRRASHIFLMQMGVQNSHLVGQEPLPPMEPLPPPCMHPQHWSSLRTPTSTICASSALALSWNHLHSSSL